MNQLFYIVSSLLHKNKIKTDLEEMKFQLLSHPSYPSLHAISATLEQFNIENIAANVPIDLETLEQLPETFLAEVRNTNENELAVVTRLDKEIEIQYPQQTNKVSVDEFLKLFTGVILAVDGEEAIAGKSSNKSLLTVFSVGLAVLAGYFFFIPTMNLYHLMYLAVSGLGLYLSVVIVKQEQGISTAIGEAFCGAANEKQSCDAVISSKGSTIFNSLKLSSLSIVYFATIVLSSLFFQLKGEAYTPLYLLSLAAIPITLYSLYYQQVVVKKWCRLCLGIVGVLWISAALAGWQSNLGIIFSFPVNQISVVVFALFASALAWNLLKPLIEEVSELKASKIGYLKFKRNYELFKFTLYKSVVQPINSLGERGIFLGNRNSPLKITFITNPLCGHCKEVHGLMEKINAKHGEELQMQVVFNVSADDLKNPATKISERILELKKTEGMTKCMEAMHEIYGDASPESWLNKWGEGKGESLEILQEDSQWCKENKIFFTPEILINGRAFPTTEYDRKDLVHFIEDLVEDVENSVSVTS